MLFLGLVMGVNTSAWGVTIQPGYRVDQFSTGHSFPTAMTFDPDGWLYLTSISGAVTALRDTNGDAVADSTVIFAANYPWTLGIAYYNGWIYLSQAGKIIRLQDIDADHVADVADTLLNGIPTGAHQNNGITFHNDTLYVAIGSDQNIGTPGHPWSAVIVRMTPAGEVIDVFAEGLRNPYDLAFHQSGSLFAPDNGPTGDSNWTCYEPPDEINWIRQGLDYGFPECIGFGDCVDVTSPSCDPTPCGAGECEWGTGCTGSTEPPLYTLAPHSAPTGMTFGDGSVGFGSDDLFVAEYGQDVYVVGCPTNFGHRVSKLEMSWSGSTWSVLNETVFMDGIGQPVAVTMGADHGLYILDFGTGTVYRVGRESGLAVDPEPPGAPAPRLLLSPNPARRTTRLHWAGMSRESITGIAVFDVSGRQVRSLELTGDRDLVWDLTDDRGTRVRAGLYMVRAELAGRGVTAKLMVLD